MTLPALKALRKGLPNTTISLLVKPWLSAIFDHTPHIDAIIHYGREHASIAGRIRLARALRKEHFCGALLLQNAFDAAFISFLAGIRQRVGYDRDGRRLLLTHAIRVPREKTHHIFYYLNLVNQIGIRAEYSYPYIYLVLDERLKARQFMSGMKRPILGINPGAAYGSAKRWVPERFAEIASWFIADTGGSVIVFGSSREVDIADNIVRSLIPEFREPDTFRNLAGQTTLRELVSLIAECDVFLSNDSGPLHIAYAVRTPSVAIFGSTDPALTGPPPSPSANGTVVISSDAPCSPCFERTCDRNALHCMYSIQSDDVYYGIKSVLPSIPAVFFDRDGTLCEDRGYINTMDELHIFPEIASLGALKETGFALIGVSNQSGIGRGLVTEEFVQQVHGLFKNRYGFDDFYHCPHHPDDRCECRKPEPEMLLRARSAFRIDLKKSFVVGDKESDMLLAKAVGAKAILVQTGKARDSVHADFTARNLNDAVEWILRETDIRG